MQKILIIQIRQLGDVLLSTPMAENIKMNMSDSEVHFLTAENAYEILELNPFIDKIHILKKGILNEISLIKKIKKLKFDTVIDIQRTGRSKKITLFSGAVNRIGFYKENENFYYNKPIKQEKTDYVIKDRLQLLKPLNIKIDTIEPKIYFNENHIKLSNKIKKDLKLNKYFIISPTARRLRKMYPYKQMGKLIDILQEKTGFQSVITYGPGEADIAKTYLENCKSTASILNKPLDIKTYASFIKDAEFFVGNNSFSSHLALTQKTKSAIFTGVETQWFNTQSEYFLQLSEQFDCNICQYNETCKKDKSLDFLKCFEDLEPKKLSEKILNFIED